MKFCEKVEQNKVVISSKQRKRLVDTHCHVKCDQVAIRKTKK